MYYDTVLSNEIARMDLERAERKAAENWRFRHLQTRQHKALVAILTSILGFLVR